MYYNIVYVYIHIHSNFKMKILCKKYACKFVMCIKFVFNVFMMLYIISTCYKILNLNWKYNTYLAKR